MIPANTRFTQLFNVCIYKFCSVLTLLGDDKSPAADFLYSNQSCQKSIHASKICLCCYFGFFLRILK